jgi:hypothetical protein
MTTKDRIPKERTISKSLREVAAQMPQEPQSLRIWVTLLEHLLQGIKDEHGKVVLAQGDVRKPLGRIMHGLAGVSMAASRAMADLIDQLNDG